MPPQSRWGDAITATRRFLDELEESPASERVTLVTYSDVARTDVGLTNKYANILGALSTYSAKFSSGATNIAQGINEGVNALAGCSSRPWAMKVLVILTDGLQTVPGDIDGAARNAAEQGAIVFTVTFSSEANQSAMENVARIGLGKHYHASTGADLVNVFRDIAKSLPTILTK